MIVFMIKIDSIGLLARSKTDAHFMAIYEYLVFMAFYSHIIIRIVQIINVFN